MVFKKMVVMMMGCLGLSQAENGESSTVDSQICDSSRIRISDGRFLAYTDPQEQVRLQGDGCSWLWQLQRDELYGIPIDLLDELKIYILLFDRAGYGDSDPNPERSLKSEASDIEELADKLQLGSKFYILGVSLGCYPVWSCLNRIPNRLAGIGLVVPYINYEWPSLPKNLTKDDYRKGLSRWTVLLRAMLPDCCICG
ncbi:hypothetical protein OROMI_015348 [Orobanche minor]